MNKRLGKLGYLIILIIIRTTSCAQKKIDSLYIDSIIKLARLHSKNDAKKAIDYANQAKKTGIRKQY